MTASLLSSPRATPPFPFPREKLKKDFVKTSTLKSPGLASTRSRKNAPFFSRPLRSISIHAVKTPPQVLSGIIASPVSLPLPKSLPQARTGGELKRGVCASRDPRNESCLGLENQLRLDCPNLPLFLQAEVVERRNPGGRLSFGYWSLFVSRATLSFCRIFRLPG